MAFRVMFWVFLLGMTPLALGVILRLGAWVVSRLSRRHHGDGEPSSSGPALRLRAALPRIDG